MFPDLAADGEGLLVRASGCFWFPFVQQDDADVVERPRHASFVVDFAKVGQRLFEHLPRSGEIHLAPKHAGEIVEHHGLRPPVPDLASGGERLVVGHVNDRQGIQRARRRAAVPGRRENLPGLFAAGDGLFRLSQIPER